MVGRRGGGGRRDNALSVNYQVGAGPYLGGISTSISGYRERGGGGQERAGAPRLKAGRTVTGTSGRENRERGSVYVAIKKKKKRKDPRQLPHSPPPPFPEASRRAFALSLILFRSYGREKRTGENLLLQRL